MQRIYKSTRQRWKQTTYRRSQSVMYIYIGLLEHSAMAAPQPPDTGTSQQHYLNELPCQMFCFEMGIQQQKKKLQSLLVPKTMH